MPLWKILILAIVQGLAELLPVSSSAHVVVAEKLLNLDPSAPDMTLLLVMLHTGTMFAVIVYFWRQWKRADLAAKNCESIAQQMRAQFPKSDFTDRAESIAFRVKQGLSVYGNDRD